MPFETIEFDVHKGVAKITLNRPDRLNAVTTQMLDELKQALREIADDESARCLLLTGAGRGFCAGQDLSDRAVNVEAGHTRPDLSESLHRGYNPFIKALADLEIPTICAVNGVAAGAGANIALACDIVLAAKSAKFIQAFAKLGLIPDSGGTWFLPRLIGLPRAKAIAMLAEPVSAEQAEDWGMIWKAVEDDELAMEAQTMARHFAEAPTMGLNLIKKAMRASYDNDLVEQLKLEGDYQGRAGWSEDYAEGVSAFMEKRAPKFRGK